MTGEEAKKILRKLLAEDDDLDFFSYEEKKAIDHFAYKEEWIPISERKPEDGEWAIFTDGSKISVERYKVDALDHFYPQERWFSFDEATAWMPLPEPYKEGDEE